MLSHLLCLFKMGIYSYSQPSDSAEYGGETSEYSETEDLIRRDQEELSLQYGDTAQYPLQYPPQPEVEFGFPQVCYCGGAPKLATSYTRLDPGRRYYTCEHVDDGECHVWKWWDVAVMEEMRARDKHVLQLEEKVDNLNLLSDYETDEKVLRLEQLVCDLAKKESSFINGFEVFIGVMLIVLVVLGLVIGLK
ncbi:uncharacterized protein LOC125578668 isoform X2 [Brassica napus]|uniref:uncharacterized protein LOC125578668 isoform X2 n=2 Tax=Brassica napus TaxID=3708 RepID=UPI00207850AF|nr:uncharacterized protein LOC125578668 isoform X2 [Brassica napus]